MGVGDGQVTDFNFVLDTESILNPENIPASGLKIGGTFTAECYDRDGKLKWKARAKNIIPNAVLNDILNVYFDASSATTTFYMGMVDNSGFTAFAAGDTMSSHSGWTENTNTSLSTRPTWTPGSASAQSIANGTQVSFPMNPSGTCTIKGFFLTSNSTLGGTTGNLVATAAIGTGPQTCSNGDTLKVTYAVNATTS